MTSRLRIRFTLRSVLLVVLSLSLVLAWLSEDLRKIQLERRAIHEIHQFPGGVFADEFYWQSSFRKGKPTPRSLLNRLLGHHHAMYVYLGAQYSEAGLSPALVRLPQNISDKDVPRIAAILTNLPRMQHLNLSMTRISEKGAEQLRQKFPAVEIEYDPANNRGRVPLLFGNPRFSWKDGNVQSQRALAADLRAAQFEDEDLTVFQDMQFSEIESIDLRGTTVGDRGLRYLQSAKSLRQLRLEGTQVSKNAVEEFRRSMPDCQVIF